MGLVEEPHSSGISQSMHHIATTTLQKSTRICPGNCGTHGKEGVCHSINYRVPSTTLMGLFHALDKMDSSKCHCIFRLHDC